MNKAQTTKKTASSLGGKGGLMGFLKPASLDKRKAQAGWIFVLPFVIGLLFVYAPIIFNSIWYSFNEIVNVRGGGYYLEFAGFFNYREALFTDPQFVRMLVSGIEQLFLDIPAIVVFALFIAVVLNQKMLGRAAFRAIFFVPVILSTGLIESIDAANNMSDYYEDGSTMGEESSTSNQIVEAVQIERLFSGIVVGSELVTYVVDLVNRVYDIVNRSGVQMLIFLSGLQSISPSIYEACKIDGATAWETFWKITFPMISPMILVNTVYTIIDSFTSESNVVMSYISGIYSKGETEIATAMSWMYFLVVLAIIGIVGAFVSGFVFYQKRD